MISKQLLTNVRKKSIIYNDKHDNFIGDSIFAGVKTVERNPTTMPPKNV